ENRDGVGAETASERVERLSELTRSVKRLQRRIEALMEELAPALLRLPGCAGLSAAKLVAETADVRRFRSSAAFAMHNGTAPIPVWSANNERNRLNGAGIRQPIVPLHQSAITQMRLEGPASAYIPRRWVGGNPRKEAIGQPS